MTRNTARYGYGSREHIKKNGTEIDFEGIADYEKSHIPELTARTVSNHAKKEYLDFCGLSSIMLLLLALVVLHTRMQNACGIWKFIQTEVVGVMNLYRTSIPEIAD
ncbi:hypothetical protein EDC01DRAFT_636429 [Geopyxis carbonaria]|nr:hypothetical protein EDC01DRAFT_636429 [Geopyxis carbonaria]